MSQSEKQINDLILAGAKRLLARAANSRSLDAVIAYLRILPQPVTPPAEERLHAVRR